jgi:hypothetical protein
MGLFGKKVCDACGEKLGFGGNRKLEDGSICKACASRLSPFTSEESKITVAEVKAHLAYREANKGQVAAFNATRTLGDKTKVLLDDGAGKFIVTTSDNWKAENPDVIPFSQVTECKIDIRESRKEIMSEDFDGNPVSYNPPKFDLDYAFWVKLQIKSPYFNEIEFKLNSNRIEKRESAEYSEFDRTVTEIKQALTQGR